MKNTKPIPFPHPSSGDDVGAALNLLRDALGEEEQRNTTQWARNKMVNVDGRMKKSSPNGVWEISDVGRTWLNKASR